ncbi:MAG TPA: hypothetical protein VJ346_04170 [Bacteroidales bacterium]|nr:hypothetical protein [Bacteroidales bacterium]
MAKVIIYLSLVERNNKMHLHLRDSSGICGDESIVTEVSRGDVIIWKRDTCSGLKNISGLVFEKRKDLFANGLSRKCCSKWKGKISDKAKGEYPYRISYIACKQDKAETTYKSARSDDAPPPVIKVRG